MKSSPPPRAAASLLLGCLLLFSGGCSRPSAPAPKPVGSRSTEQGWIVGSIADDLARLATFAAGSERWTPPDAVDVREGAGGEPGRRYALAIRLPDGGEPIKSDLTIPGGGSAWSPEGYLPMLRALFTRLKISPPPAGDAAPGTLPDADFVSTLVNPLTPEIESQNQRISGWLQTHPLDAQAHAQAALLLGTLAMRENSGLFWNPRGLCNRAAAHLAFARALRPEVSECGEIAELLIGLIIDTKADCAKRLAALQTRLAAHPELGPWITAATMRNTRDYRVLTNPQTATFLERVEQFRAMTEAIGSEQAVKRLGNYKPATAPDWARLALQVGFGVDVGHQFAMPAVGMELNDAATIFPELRAARAPAQFAAVFNPPPGSVVQTDADRHAHVQVIDRGTWAQFFQRHLLQASNETYNFLQNLWGVPDEARNFRVQMGPLLERLTLYPLCLDILGKENGDALLPRAADLLNQHPEWVSDGAWASVVKTVPVNYATGGSWNTVSGAWFSPRLPIGTAYGFDWRTDAGHVLPSPSLSELQTAHDIAPLKYDVCRVFLNATSPGHHATDASYKQVMGPLLDYYVPAMWGEAWLVKDDPAQYGAAMNRAAALNPNHYLELGKYYVEHRMDAEAAQAYQAASDHGADAVSMANASGWLVNYYYDHGQKDRAMAIAQRSAEVYSFDGLAAMAGLLERMDRFSEAESYYEKIKERYDDARPLQAFYLRASSSRPEYAQKAQTMEGDVFPQGIQTVTLAQLSGKPERGVLVHGENMLSRRCGLKPGAVIVGIDGRRVSNLEQYFYVRGLSTSPDLTLLVYQDEHYQDIHTQVPNRKFDLIFTSWP